MKIATFNVNGIKTRLPNLLEWLQREQPDVACLQELKALDGAFPQAALHEAGYGSVWKGQRSWNGVAILARGLQPVEVRRELPGEPGDEHARYLEAAVDGVVVACLYLPNGNPQPGPKSRPSRSGTISASTGSATPDCASTTSCSMRRSRRHWSRAASTGGCADRSTPATMPRRGWSWTWDGSLRRR